MRKRSISILLILCLVLSLLPCSAFAEETETREDGAETENVSGEAENASGGTGNASGETEDDSGETEDPAVDGAEPDGGAAEQEEDEGVSDTPSGAVDSAAPSEDAEGGEPEVSEDAAPVPTASSGTITYPVTGGNLTFSDGKITGCDKTVTEADIPAEINGKKVGGIGYQAFLNCSKLTRVTIPESVTKIESRAFQGCSSLTSVKIPSQVTRIEQGTFLGCSSMSSIIIPDGVTAIINYAFSECKSLTRIEIPASVTSFWGPSITECTGLTEISVSSENSKYKDIDGILFDKAEKTLYAYPAGRRGTYTIPSSVTKIDYYAFDSSGLTSVTIPSSVTSIENGAFSSSSLTSVTIPNSVTSIGNYAFYNCNGLTSMTIPNSVTSIGRGAFGDCSGLTSVTIPNSVTNIDEQMFYSSGLTSVTIPSSVASIGQRAFSHCEGLKDVYYQGDEQQWQSIAIDSYNECLTNATIHYREFVEQAPPADETVTVDSNQYYDTPERRLFRIRPDGAAYPAPADFTVTVGGKTFSSGAQTCAGTDDINVDIPDSYTGSITVSRQGYHTNTIPAGWAGAYNTVVMTPNTETGPFAQTFLLDMSSPSYKSFSNRLYGDSPLSIYERGLTEEAKTYRCYVSVEWNNHGAGTVWLEQGAKRVALKDNDVTEVAFGEAFSAGKYIYLAAKAADGTAFRRKTTITVLTPANSGLSLDLGDDISVDTTKAQKLEGVLPGKVSVDFKLADGVVPIKFEEKDDGSVTGVFGLGPKASYSEASYGAIKEAVNGLLDPEKTSSNREFAKTLSDLKKQGVLLTDIPHSSFGVKGNIQVLGYFTGKFVNGEPRLTEVKGAVVLKGSISYAHNTIITTLVGPIPAYFKISLEAAVNAAVKMKYDESAGGLACADVDQPLTVSASLSAEAGPGWEGYVSGSVRAKGTYTVYSSLPIKSEKTSMTLSANFAFVGTLSGLTGEWTFYKTKEMVFWEAGAFKWEEKDSNAAKTMVFVPDLRQTPMLFSAAAGGSAVASNISGYAAPDLAELSDGRLLAVWTADVSGRSGVDKNGIYYSVRSAAGVWSAPQLAWEDGTNDSLPKLWQAGGDIWLTWQNYTRAFNTDSLAGLSYETISSQVDIAAARFDSTTGKFTGGSSLACSGYAYNPQIRLENGLPCAAWTDGNGRLWCSTYNGSSWSEAVQRSVSWYEAETALPSSYTGEAPQTTSPLQTFSTADYQAILYTAENDNGAANVYGLFNDGFGWGEPVQLTEVSDGSICGFSAVISEDNVIKILANKAHLGEDGTYESADLEFYEKSLSTDLTVTAADYIHDTLVAGKTLTLSVDVTNNSAKTVSGLTVQVGDSPSSDHAVTLLPGQSKIVYVNYTLPNSFASRLSVTVSPKNGTDADPSDNAVDCTLQMTDISLEKVSAEAAETGTNLTSMIVNRGSTAIQGYTVTYRANTPDGQVIGSESVNTALQPGEAAYLNTLSNTRIEPETMVYAEVAMASAADENLYGNNSNQTMVVNFEQSDKAECVSLSSWAVNGSATRVKLYDPASLLSKESKIFAANYTGGKMTDIVSGVWSNDEVVFERKLSESWTIFLTDPNAVPLCPQIRLTR